MPFANLLFFEKRSTGATSPDQVISNWRTERMHSPPDAADLGQRDSQVCLRAITLRTRSTARDVILLVFCWPSRSCRGYLKLMARPSNGRKSHPRGRLRLSRAETGLER